MRSGRTAHHMALYVHAHFVFGGIRLSTAELVHEAAVLVHPIEELVLSVLVLFGVQLLVVGVRVGRELNEVASLCNVHVGVEAAVFGEVCPVGHDATRHATIVAIECTLLKPWYAKYVLDFISVKNTCIPK